MTDLGLNAETAKLIGLVLATVIGALFGNSALRRRFSKDKVVLAENQGEVGMIARLEAEIDRGKIERQSLLDRADRLQAERNDAVLEMGGLRANVLALSTQIEKLEREVEALREQIRLLLQFHDFNLKSPLPPPGGETDG
jgi:cell division protein FtsB